MPKAGADSPSAAALIAEAERSMTDGDYRAGVTGYVDAALAGDSVETARQATLTAHRFGFNAAAIEAADRWLALDPNGWQADVYAATAALRAGDTRAATERLVRRLAAQQSAAGGIGTIEDSCELMRELSQGIRPEDAQRVLDTLAKQFKSTPCVIQLAASSALGNDAYRDAERHLKRLRKLDAFDDQARLTEMARLIATDDIDEALSRDELRLSDAATVEQRIESAFLHVRAEQTETALNMLSLLQTEHPDDAGKFAMDR